MRNRGGSFDLLVLMTAVFGGHGAIRSPDTWSRPREPRNEFQVAAKRAKRLERGRRQYEKWVISRGGRP